MPLRPEPKGSRTSARRVRKTRTYTADERANAVTLAGRIGVGEAAKLLAIPRGSITEWTRRSNVTPARTPGQASRIEQQSRRYLDIRAGLADKAGEAADEALDLARQMLAQGRARDAQAAATTAGILIDKSDKITDQASLRVSVGFNLGDSLRVVAEMFAKLDGRDPSEVIDAEVVDEPAGELGQGDDDDSPEVRPGDAD